MRKKALLKSATSLSKLDDVVSPPPAVNKNDASHLLTRSVAETKAPAESKTVPHILTPEQANKYFLATPALRLMRFTLYQLMGDKIGNDVNDIATDYVYDKQRRQHRFEFYYWGDQTPEEMDRLDIKEQYDQLRIENKITSFLMKLDESATPGKVRINPVNRIIYFKTKSDLFNLIKHYLADGHHRILDVADPRIGHFEPLTQNFNGLAFSPRGALQEFQERLNRLADINASQDPDFEEQLVFSAAARAYASERDYRASAMQAYETQDPYKMMLSMYMARMARLVRLEEGLPESFERSFLGEEHEPEDTPDFIPLPNFRFRHELDPVPDKEEDMAAWGDRQLAALDSLTEKRGAGTEEEEDYEDGPSHSASALRQICALMMNCLSATAYTDRFIGHLLATADIDFDDEGYACNIISPQYSLFEMANMEMTSLEEAFYGDLWEAITRFLEELDVYAFDEEKISIDPDNGRIWFRTKMDLLELIKTYLEEKGISQLNIHRCEFEYEKNKFFTAQENRQHLKSLFERKASLARNTLAITEEYGDLLLSSAPLMPYKSYGQYLTFAQISSESEEPTQLSLSAYIASVEKQIKLEDGINDEYEFVHHEDEDEKKNVTLLEKKYCPVPPTLH